MATYGDGTSEYPYRVLKRRKQKYSLFTKVIDFTQLPVTTAIPGNDKFATTAWAAADVLETIRIRAGQTVLGLQIEILTPSLDKLDTISLGYGDDADRWGVWNLSKDAGVKDYPNADGKIRDGESAPTFGEPVYFGSADTVDITVNRAAIEGKIRLIIHILEDDR